MRDPGPLCIHQLVEQAATVHPERTAVVDGRARLTYRALDARAGRLAAYLAELGVGPEVQVGVFLERSAEFVVTVLAILKAGGSYVPLDPQYPPTGSRSCSTARTRRCS
ncbi:AMP-binding protein [Rhodococcus opacus]|nr:AMP-binding protein [Rhodococcus opacus]